MHFFFTLCFNVSLGALFGGFLHTHGVVHQFSWWVCSHFLDSPYNIWFPRHSGNKLVHQNLLDHSYPFLTCLTHFAKNGWGYLVTLGTTTLGFTNNYFVLSSFFVNFSNYIMTCKCLLNCFEYVQQEIVVAALHNPCIQWCVGNIKLCVWSCRKWVFGILIFMGVRKVVLLGWLSNDSIIICRKCVLCFGYGLELFFLFFFFSWKI